MTENTIHTEQQDFMKELDFDIKDLLVRIGNHPGFPKYINWQTNEIFNIFANTKPEDDDTRKVLRYKVDFLTELAYLVDLQIKETAEEEKGE